MADISDLFEKGILMRCLLRIFSTLAVALSPSAARQFLGCRALTVVA
jgi:hypothetical protein